MKQYLLGIDVGTTGAKTLLYSNDGELLGHAYRPYDTKIPQPLYSEQNPEDWWSAVCETIREVCSDPDAAQRVAAVSLSVQGGTLVPVDENLRPVRPAIVWNDTRGIAEKEAYLREAGDSASMYEKSGWQLGCGMNALMIRWMRDHEPELFEKTDMFLSVPDYISAKMTGIAALDVSNSGINQMADIRKGCYDPELLQFAGVTEDKLGKIVTSGDVIGHLTAEAAAATGLSTNCVLVAGAHDQYCVTLGAGANRAGDILIGSGTCWVVTAMGDAPAFETGLAQSVAAVSDLWGSLRSLPTGGVCLEWWRKNLADMVSYEELNRETADRKAAEDGLFFIPFSGFGDNDVPFGKATFVGMDLYHDKYHLARAVMEGVVFQTLWMLEKFPVKPVQEGLLLTGGASKSPVWGQLVADISGLPVRIPEVADLGCVGAAILAGVGCGIYADAAEGYAKLGVKERVLQPNPGAAAKYQKAYEEFKRIATTLQETYQV